MSNKIECKLWENFACNCKQSKLNVVFTWKSCTFQFLKLDAKLKSPYKLSASADKDKNMSLFMLLIDEHILRLNSVSEQTISSYFFQFYSIKWEKHRKKPKGA